MKNNIKLLALLAIYHSLLITVTLKTLVLTPQAQQQTHQPYWIYTIT